MSENMEKFRHLDGNPAVIDQEFVKIVFQHGNPATEGVNGCSVSDVIDILVNKLLDFQGRDLACEENAIALHHLDLAREALILRTRRREQQGLLGSRQRHS